MKKYGRHYLRRGLSVLLAVVMTCAAAQSLVYAVELAENDMVTPGWNEGTARARYTTSGTLEISFPEADVQNGDGTGVEYYADFYDLDAVDGNGDSTREDVLNQTPILLNNTTRMYAEGEASQLLTATLSPEEIETIGLDMSHRISIAVTAVKNNWRSEPIEALVGESLDVPQAGSSPNGNDKYVSFASFNVGDNTSYDTGDNPDSVLPSWLYNGTNYSNGLQEGQIPTNPDGVFGGGGTTPNKDIRYDTPGFDSTSAFRMYVREATDNYQTLDLTYNQDHYQFINADELWIWLDTSYIEFDELAFRVRFVDHEGELHIDSYDLHERAGDGSYPTGVYSEDVYSTVGYSKDTGNSVPVYKLNEDGLWDVIYTNENGYLENFGHYRGFLRVPIEYLVNENYDAETHNYRTLDQKRPYNYTIRVYDDHEYVIWDDFEVTHFTAKYAFENKDTLEWEDTYNYDHTWGIPWEWFWETRTISFDEEKLNAAFNRGLGIVPLEDIASIGIQWKCTDADSTSKPFYIDQIGFSGENLITNSSDEGINGSLDEVKMVPSDRDAVKALFDKYIDPNAVNVSDAGVLQDLQDICAQLNVQITDIQGLQDAIDQLDAILAGGDVVSYLSNRLSEITTEDDVTSEEIQSLYELYRSFTLGQLHELGLQDEAKLIDLYNKKGSNEWFPDEDLNNMYFKPFSDIETGYSVGDTALHEYDDYNPVPGGSVHYYDRGHILEWSKAGVDMNQAWENSRNLLAYSRVGYDDVVDSTRQRFGYGITTVGQNGFANSQSIDTQIYRETIDDSGYENYRVSLTYNGSNTGNWDTLEKGDFTGADYFTFYADFSNVTEIRKLWTTIRTGDGTIYSHDETDSVWPYQAFSLDNPDAGWYPLYSDTDGCLSEGLVGFRGFIRIPISVFNEIGGNDRMLTNLSNVGQVKVFWTGDPGNNVVEAGSSFVLDMFGFISDTQDAVFTQTLMQQYHHEVDLPDPIADPMTEFNNALDNGLFVPAEDINGGDLKLLDYSEATASLYDQLINAYHTMTLGQKADANEDLLAASGGKFTEVDQLKLFVTNYDTWNNTQGMLAQNADKADTNRKTVVDAFTAGTEIAVTTPIDNILDTYDKYPSYYQYAVQTYWPDRNLHAVYPNFNPKDIIPTDGVTMRYNEADGGQYITTFNFDYVGMVGSEAVDASMKFQVNDLILKSGDGTEITINVSGITTGDPVANGDTNKQITLSVPAANVPAGNYSGELVISFDVLPDSNNGDEASNPDPVADPDQYRKTITIPVTLTSVATYTVTIPADVTVPWGEDLVEVPGYAVKECFMPNGSSLTLTISSKNNYGMLNGDKKIEYVLDGQKEITNITQPTEADIPLTVTVAEDQWTQGGLAQGIYQDTLTFTVELVQTGDVA